MTTTKKDNYVINILKEKATESKLRMKHCACLTCGGKVMCINVNTSRTKFCSAILPCGHSELMCIYEWWNTCKKKVDKKKRKLSRMKLYVLRLKPNGKMGNSAPCILCTNFMKECGIKKISYSDSDGNIISINISDYETKHESNGFIATKGSCRILKFPFK